MKKRALSQSLRFVAATLPFILASAVAVAQTASLSVIADLGTQGAEEGTPGPISFDHAGNIVGTTQYGGKYSDGSVFELIPKADGYWTQKTIVSFSAPDFSPGESQAPNGPLVFDADGNLYGTTGAGGTNGQGAVFKLSPSGDGSWTKTDIYSFEVYGAPDGDNPTTGVVFDNEGNLYGVTYLGGKYNQGTIFELSPQKDGSWAETVLHSFVSPIGGTSSAGLTFDKAGNLYGATQDGYAGGVVFCLTKPQSEGGNWSYTTLHTFPNVNEPNPNGDAIGVRSTLTLDAKGNLYGSGYYGGAHNQGAVFEILAGGGVNGPDKILYSFHSADAFNSRFSQNPEGNLVFDAEGNLYGTTHTGGPYYGIVGGDPDNPLYDTGGKIFEMLPQKDGSWSVTSLHDFGGQTYEGVPGADGESPDSLIIGPDGNFYGTTLTGGYIPGQDLGAGTVFKLVAH